VQCHGSDGVFRLILLVSYIGDDIPAEDVVHDWDTFMGPEHTWAIPCVESEGVVRLENIAWPSNTGTMQ